MRTHIDCLLKFSSPYVAVVSLMHSLKFYHLNGAEVVAAASAPLKSTVTVAIMSSSQSVKGFMVL